jgi:hypothetical protein
MKNKNKPLVFLTQPQNFDNAWYVGLVHGDGYWGLRMYFNKKSIRFYASFSLGMEIEAELTLNMFQSKFHGVGTKKNENNLNRIDHL